MLNKLKLYKNKKVFITGNSGFKGAWLTVFLKELGADVIGYSDKIKWEKSIFDYNTINSSISLPGNNFVSNKSCDSTQSNCIQINHMNDSIDKISSKAIMGKQKP